MARFQVVVLFIACAVVATHAEPQRRRTRVLARQQAADETPVTPYPSADELKPEVAFDESAGGPPADLVPQADDAFAAVPEARNVVPDEVYGPPENELAAEEPAAEQFADAEQARVGAAALRVAHLRQRQGAAASKRAAKLKAAANNKQH